VICPDVVTAQLVCPHCQHRWQATYQCPIPSEAHVGTPMPDVKANCPNCEQSGAKPQAYWLRMEQVPG